MRSTSSSSMQTESSSAKSPSAVDRKNCTRPSSTPHPVPSSSWLGTVRLSWSTDRWSECSVNRGSTASPSVELVVRRYTGLKNESHTPCEPVLSTRRALGSLAFFWLTVGRFLGTTLSGRDFLTRRTGFWRPTPLLISQKTSINFPENCQF